MRIGTYNVLGLTGYPPEEAGKALGDPLGETAAAHFAGVFGGLGCDILALQEGVPRIHPVARIMGVNAATFPSPINWPGHLLTRFPILESRTFSHFAPDASSLPLSRTAGAALLEIGPGRRLWMVVIHLYPGLAEDRRARRAPEAVLVDERVAALLSDVPNVIVLGDFNCEVSEDLHHRLKNRGFANAMERVGGGLRPTIGAHAIDHIYVSPALADRLTFAEVIRRPGFCLDDPKVPGQWAHSDHVPVVADLAWP
jgi:endonuclease/exonuclease/phosphatase family metal-dependent hydrolase